MKALDKILAAIGEGNYRPSGDGYSCRCPAHDDNSPSLSITPKDGKVLLHCHAGCSFEQILSSLGLQKNDIFDSYRAAAVLQKNRRNGTQLVMMLSQLWVGVLSRMVGKLLTLSPTLTLIKTESRLGAVCVLILQMAQRHFDKFTLTVTLGFLELVVSRGHCI